MKSEPKDSREGLLENLKAAAYDQLRIKEQLINSTNQKVEELDRSIAKLYKDITDIEQALAKDQ